MFEFGRDLRKLFDKARESEDLGWLELIGADLVELEARRESTDAGRVSCTRPFAATMRACALWREHVRRTGRQASLDRGVQAASDAARHAKSPDHVALVAIESGELHLLKFDLFGGPQSLTAAIFDIQNLPTDRSETRARAAGLQARLSARQACLSGDPIAMMDAAALMDAALRNDRSLSSVLSADLRLDRAALTLEAGVARRDPALLDRAGRDLRILVESASPDYRPVTRARALALAGAGLSALATLASDDAAHAQGRALFEAAADQFTPDHSPLDWVAVQLTGADADTPLMTLAQMETLTREPGLILGALTRERRHFAEIALAESLGDLAGLAGMKATIVQRLTQGRKPVDWAADQIVMVHLALAQSRMAKTAPKAIGMMLAEAIETAREWGAPALVHRAVSAMPEAARV